MAAPVRLKDIVDALQIQVDELSSYVDTVTGKVHTVTRDEIRAAEEEEEEPDLDDEEFAIPWRVFTMDKTLVELPDKREVNEWSIMEEFSESVKSSRIRGELLNAIQGAGAFRYFRDTIKRHRMEQDWYAFRDDALRQIAIDWCEENDIPYA
uniref:Uncharacterized protein n=1 Tax=Solibacter usitatus (strain Ellin6076) TaxID=234267 RepID=Q021F0_SOLUE